MRRSQIPGAMCAVAVVVGTCATSPVAASEPSRAELDKIRVVARQKFDQACKSSGEKIYKVVRDVDSIHLAKMREEPPTGSRSNKYWDEAGLPLEETGDGYVMEFLARESRFVTVYGPSSVTSFDPRDHPGYEYVTVGEDDESARFLYLRVPSPGDWKVFDGERRTKPLYEVTFSPIDDVQLRDYWIAGLRIVVRDRKSGSVLGERISYAYHPGQGHANVGYPWVSVYQCPETNSSIVTRQFVTRVLVPKGDIK